MRKFIYIVVFISLFCEVSAQELPERGLVRKGNRAFNKGNYERSAERYGDALKQSPTSFEAGYNLSNALYKAERYEKSEELFNKMVTDTLQMDSLRAVTHYNLGNSQFKQEKYKEALESYKNSLRLNPSDMEAKYNYAYTKKLLDDNENEDQDKDDKDDKDDDENQDKQDGDDQKSDDPQDNEQDDNEDGEQDDKQNESQPTESGISPQEQEQMLDAIQAQEDKTQEKLEEGKGVVVRGHKNW